MNYGVKENGWVATQPSQENQPTGAQHTAADLRDQALEGATHLSRMACFEDVYTTMSFPLDIRYLFRRKSDAAKRELARPKLRSRAIYQVACDGTIPRTGFKSDEMALLAVDLDDGKMNLKAVREAAVAFFGDSIGSVFSTASSSPDRPRWRLFVPLAQPTKFEVWLRILRAFAHYLTSLGVAVDATAQLVAQLQFLPNVGWTALNKETGREIATRNPLTGEPFHFVHEFWGASLFNPTTLTATAMQALAGLDQLDKAKEQEDERKAAEAALKRAAREALRQEQLAAGGDGLTPIERFNLENETEDLLLEYGYIPDPNKPGNWRSPMQTSCTFATMVRDDGSWFSKSGSDAAAGLGSAQAGGVGGDAFDLFVHFQHEGDFARAVASVANRGDLSAFTGVATSEGDGPSGGIGNEAAAMRVSTLGIQAVEFTAETERREQQREASRIIGQGTQSAPLMDRLTLESALSSLVMVGGHSVALKDNPKVCPSFEDFSRLSAASQMQVRRPDKPPVVRPVAMAWKDHPKRITVMSMTFRPGCGTFTHDPRGVSAFNTWRPIKRHAADVTLAEPFFDHIRRLWGDQAEAFLDWLAHIEQRPGELPHHGWLHISVYTGTGRNFIEAVLARLWAGHVAASLNLQAVLNSGFNADLSGKLLAVVDEVRMGGVAARWNEAEQLKEMMTASVRTINPKYGRQLSEFNVTRWLVFSNHVDALPLHDNDRRWNVVLNNDKPMPSEYYSHLYSLLDNPGFIDAVALTLQRRDLSSFNPGAHALKSDARERVVRSAMSELDVTAQAIVDNWPSDVISNRDLLECFNAASPTPSGVHETTGPMRSALMKFGAVRAKSFKSHGYKVRGWVLRNANQWETAQGVNLAAELDRGKATGGLCRWLHENIDGAAPCIEGERVPRLT